MASASVPPHRCGPLASAGRQIPGCRWGGDAREVRAWSRAFKAALETPHLACHLAHRTGHCALPKPWHGSLGHADLEPHEGDPVSSRQPLTLTRASSSRPELLPSDRQAGGWARRARPEPVHFLGPLSPRPDSWGRPETLSGRKEERWGGGVLIASYDPKRQDHFQEVKIQFVVGVPHFPVAGEPLSRCKDASTGPAQPTGSSPDKSVCPLALRGLMTWQSVLAGAGRWPFIHLFSHAFIHSLIQVFIERLLQTSCCARHGDGHADLTALKHMAQSKCQLREKRPAAPGPGAQ